MHTTWRFPNTQFRFATRFFADWIQTACTVFGLSGSNGHTSKSAVTRPRHQSVLLLLCFSALPDPAKDQVRDPLCNKNQQHEDKRRMPRERIDVRFIFVFPEQRKR
jgi:hypothetical protein